MSAAPVMDDELGVPRLLWGQAAQQPVLAHGSRKATDVEAAGRARLAEVAPQYKLTARGLDAVEVLEVRSAGTRLVRFGQRFEGLPVLGRELNLTLDANGGLVLASGNLSPTPPQTGFALAAEAAFKVAWRAATEAGGGPGTDAPAPQLQPLALNDGWIAIHAAGPATGRWQLAPDSRVRKAWLHDGRALRPAFDFELTLRDGEGLTQALALRVDGADGRLFERRSLTHRAVHQYRVWAGTAAPSIPLDGPQGNGLLPYPAPAPDGAVPNAIARNLISVDATSYRPTRPWIPDIVIATGNATSRDGHQVSAFADADGGGDGTFGDITATSAAQVFDFAFDDTLTHDASTEQVRATLMHGFYVVNHIADWFYPAGFDEAGGNHQWDNFGLGGLGGDPLILQTSDPELSNNASASVPSDGASPRIQMGVWQGDLLRRLRVDGTLGTAVDLQGNAEVGSADFGPKDYDLTGALVVARDDAGVDPFDLCEPPSNAADFAGKIALVKRGTCLFVDKAATVQAAGAVGMVVDNHTATGQPNGGIINMGNTNPAVTIPSMFVTLEDGATLRAALAGGEDLDAHLERTSGVSVDSAADSSIVAHEWGHVLVNRNLITSFPLPPGGGCVPDPPCRVGPQPSGFNEGMADFVSRLYLTDASGAGNAHAGAYADGQWSASRAIPDGGYFGTRRYPYSTDMSRNPLTFQHIAAGSVLPLGIPVAEPVGDPTEVHNVGEVWAVTLWDAYVGMLNSTRYTHAAARDRMREYVVAALKSMPDDPTFLEARDVYYAVVLARSRDDHTLFAQAFAKRGMGQGAVGPAVSNEANSGIVESVVVEPTPPAPPPPPPPPPASGGGGLVDPALVLLVLGAALLRRRWRRSAVRS